jgi:hypothetical protein
MKIETIGTTDTEGQLGDWELKISFEDYLVVTYETGYTAEEAFSLAEGRLYHLFENDNPESVTAELKATYPNH